MITQGKITELLTPYGQSLIRRRSKKERWFMAMKHSNDPVLIRLGSQIMVSTALDTMFPERIELRNGVGKNDYSQDQSP